MIAGHAHACKINYFRQTAGIGNVISRHAHAKFITSDSAAFPDLLPFVNNEHIKR